MRPITNDDKNEIVRRGTMAAFTHLPAEGALRMGMDEPMTFRDFFDAIEYLQEQGYFGEPWTLRYPDENQPTR